MALRRAVLGGGLALALLGPCAGLQAQGAALSPGDRPGSTPVWGATWSPLDLGFPPRDASPGLLVGLPAPLSTDAPRAGLFWTAGDPSALAQDVDSTRAIYRLDVWRRTGGYRRPLDPGAESHLRADISGWRKVGPHTGVIGGVSLDRSRLDHGAFADMVEPYAASPLVTIDTTGGALGRTAARLNGALGHALGALDLGIALGYEAQETRTVASPAPRLDRSTVSGAGLGISYAPGIAGLRLALDGRWRRFAETVQVVPLNASARLYEMSGFSDPSPFDILHGNVYVRRADGDTRAATLSLRGALPFGVWVAYGGPLDESLRQTDDQGVVSNIRYDRWHGSGSLAGAAVQLDAGRGARITARVERVSERGQARLQAVGAVVFRQTQTLWRFAADVRMNPGSDWTLDGRIGAESGHYFGSDAIAANRADIHTTRADAAVALARRLGSRLALSIAAGLGSFLPAGAVPVAASLGPVYIRYVGPALAIAGAPAGSTDLAATVRYNTGSALLWLEARSTRTAPASSENIVSDRPGGDRAATALTFGVTLH